MTATSIKALEKKLRSISDKKKTYLFITPPACHKEVKGVIFRHFTSHEQKPCLYVTLNKSYTRILQDLGEQKCNTSHLYFIDGISGSAKEDKETANVMFISNPHALTELSLAISTAAKTKRFALLFFDSLDTLLIYNDLKTAQKFSHYLISNLRDLDVGGILFSIESQTASQLIPVLTQFCDECIHVEELLPKRKQ